VPEPKRNLDKNFDEANDEVERSKEKIELYLKNLKQEL